MSNPLFQKPKNVRFVDMAIYIDENIYKVDRDESKIFIYMYLLAYMLAQKAGYFTTGQEYDEFAYFLACDVWKRMNNPNRGKIKSVLNYMKSIISFRKMLFNEERFSEVADPYQNKFDADAFRVKNIEKISEQNEVIIRNGVNDIIEHIPYCVKSSIPAVYTNDKITYVNLYKSALITLLNAFSLSNEDNNLLHEKLSSAARFDASDFYSKHFTQTIILQKLSKDYSDIVTMIVNKALMTLKNDIAEFSSEFDVSDIDYDIICATTLAEEGKFDE